MKFKNVLLVVAAAVVFGGVAKAAEAGPMPHMNTTWGQQIPLNQHEERGRYSYWRADDNRLFVAVNNIGLNIKYVSLTWSPDRGQVLIDADRRSGRVLDSLNQLNNPQQISYTEMTSQCKANYDNWQSWLQQQRDLLAAQAAVPAPAVKYYRDERTEKYYRTISAEENPSGKISCRELALVNNSLREGDLYDFSPACVENNFITLTADDAQKGLIKQQENHTRSVRRRNTLAAIAAVIAALTSWRAYKHRNLVVDANSRTSETEAALANLAWYDRGSVHTARALQSLLSRLKSVLTKK